LAQVALQRFFALGVQPNRAERARLDTCAATDAFFLIEDDDVCLVISGDCCSRANFRARRVRALMAGDRLVYGRFRLDDSKARFSRVEHPLVAKSAVQLANSAPGTFDGISVEVRHASTQTLSAFAYLSYLHCRAIPTPNFFELKSDWETVPECS